MKPCVVVRVCMLLVVPTAPSIAQDLLSNDHPLFSHKMADLQQQLDEARRQQGNDVMQGPEAVQLDQLTIQSIQEQMQNLASQSPEPMAGTDLLARQRDQQEDEFRTNTANADVYDDDPRPY